MGPPLTVPFLMKGFFSAHDHAGDYLSFARGVCGGGHVREVLLESGESRMMRRWASRATEPVPTRIVAKLRMEKKGRGGKTVTVVYGLPRTRRF